MNIVIMTVAGASIAFLLCFLMALSHEQKTAPRMHKAYLINPSNLTQSGRMRALTRVKLRMVRPEELRAESLLGSVKVPQKRRIG